MPEWMKSGFFMFFIMVAWDIIRMPIQAKVNQWILKKDFDEIDEALDDVEEAITEEEINDTNNT